MLKTLAFVLMFSLPLYAADSLAQPKGKAVPEEDELGIPSEAELLKEGEKQPVKREIPPIKMIFVKGGCFEMGDKKGIGDEDERPAHKVCVKDFNISETEVTQELFLAVMGFNISRFQDPKKPVNIVSWHIANRFIERLNEQTKGYYRMPTEAEWEYAARSGGLDDIWPGTNDEEDLKEYAWFEDNADEELHQVKTRKPNRLGIYDMAGNVWEWVEDNFDFDYYQTSPTDDPYGPENSYWRVIRGGSIAEDPYKLRTTYRYGFIPNLRSPLIGLRLAQ